MSKGLPLSMLLLRLQSWLIIFHYLQFGHRMKILGHVWKLATEIVIEMEVSFCVSSRVYTCLLSPPDPLQIWVNLTWHKLHLQRPVLSWDSFSYTISFSLQDGCGLWIISNHLVWKPRPYTAFYKNSFHTKYCWIQVPYWRLVPMTK